LTTGGSRTLVAQATGSSPPARVLAAGGPPMWEEFMDELREAHLGPQARRRPTPDGPAVHARIDDFTGACGGRPPVEYEALYELGDLVSLVA
jgi:hypothetical protein